MECFSVGSRVRDGDGYRGTVLYIGPVAAAKNKAENWLGVQWDKGDRGKHDGSCVDEHGILFRYFDCPMGAGSFVKANKVTAGRTFVEALRERYVALDAPEITNPDDSTLPDAFVVTAKGHQKGIEFLGERKIRKWQQIGTVDKVAIRDDSISSIGEGIAELAGHFTDIDLQDNLLWQWSELACLATQVPGLRTLQLHGNKMQQLAPEIVALLPPLCFQGLRVLALNACNISSWAAVQSLEPLLPAIEELYLSSNSLADLPRANADAAYAAATGIDSVFAPAADGDAASAATSAVGVGAGPAPARARAVSGFARLRVLDISGCALDEWSQALSFAALPALAELLLDGNPISKILPAGPEGGFAALQRISASSSQIASWSDVDALATYPAICNLRLSHIPLFAGKGASEVRPVVIGRVRQLLLFNGSYVGARERVDSEKAYLRSAIRDVEDATAAGLPLGGAALSRLHPRYAELQTLHGADLLPMGSASTGGNIAAELVSVTLRNLSFASHGSLEPMTKKLPAGLTVGRLRALVKQVFGLDAHLQQLSIRIYKDSVPTLLDDDEATLGYYGAIDGCEIYINEAKA